MKKGYSIKLPVPNDDQIKTRDRFLRWVCLIVSSALLIGAPMSFLGYWGSLFEHETIGILIGLIIGGIAEAWLAPKWMFVYNPEWTAYVTQDAFSGTMVPYGPGLHPSYWWEERSEKGNYSLRVITRPFEADIATKTSKVLIKGEYEYAILLRRIYRAVGVDESTVEEGITAFIESFLTSKCAREDAEDVRGMIDSLNENLAEEFMDTENKDVKGGCEKPSKIEENYGFVTVGIVIEKIAFPEAVQNTRDALDEAETLFGVVATLHGTSKEVLKQQLKDGIVKQPEYQKMLTRAMAVSGNKTTIDVRVIEGLEGSQAGPLGATLSALNNGGGKS